jgi:hypothetical protein
MTGFKLALWLVAGVAIAAGVAYWDQDSLESRRDDAMYQLDDTDLSARAVRMGHWRRNAAYGGLLCTWVATGGLLFGPGLLRWIAAKSRPRPGTLSLLAAALALSTTGCYRPYEPIHLETISTSEEGFLIPYAGDSKKQASSNNEEYLKQNLVYSKQIRIPQQWIQKGYETTGPNGDWQDAAKLIKVDKSPVTREWTADPNSGTSNKNEAIWVMTSDQVEFSTGWTCTSRIESRDDAVRFLHNYPAGSLQGVMDGEIRARIQATFGIEVTDLPMDELRKKATPHVQAVVTKVTDFFKARGITITNLGITGGFVYKDRTVGDTMVKVFNAEQEKSLAAAATAAQDEKNKQIRMQAEGKAQALLTERKAEADGIRMVADAKAYEIEKAKEDLKGYLDLKRIELENAKIAKWDGRFPTTFMGGLGGDKGIDMLLQVPTPAVEAKR